MTLETSTTKKNMHVIEASLPRNPSEKCDVIGQVLNKSRTCNHIIHRQLCRVLVKERERDQSWWMSFEVYMSYRMTNCGGAHICAFHILVVSTNFRTPTEPLSRTRLSSVTTIWSPERTHTVEFRVWSGDDSNTIWHRVTLAACRCIANWPMQSNNVQIYTPQHKRNRT